jgi:hypothetical protein
MKRRALSAGSTRGFELDREGSRHSWFVNRAVNRRSADPRHPEIRDELVREICRDFGIEPPDHT